MSIISDVTKYLTDRENQYCHLSDMHKEFGYTYAQIRGAINAKRYEDKEWASHVTVVTRGNTWKWNSDVASVHTTEADMITTQKTNLYEQIGSTKNGDLILQDEDGNLFRATELT